MKAFKTVGKTELVEVTGNELAAICRQRIKKMKSEVAFYNDLSEQAYRGEILENPEDFNHAARMVSQMHINIVQEVLSEHGIHTEVVRHLTYYQDTCAIVVLDALEKGDFERVVYLMEAAKVKIANFPAGY